MDCETIVSLLKNHSYDSDRNKTLSGLIQISNITSSYIPRIISCYRYDSDRNKALGIIVDHIQSIDSNDVVQLCSHYVYDSDRNKGLAIILKKITIITSNDLSKLTGLYKYGDDIYKAVKTLLPCIRSIKQVDLITISNQLKYDSDKSKVIPLLIEKCSAIEDTSNYKDNDANKPQPIKNIDFFTLMKDINSSSDDDKLLVIQKSISFLNISNVESKCKEIREFFKTDITFKKACDLLGINPTIVEEVEKEIKKENESKIQKNELITICDTNYHKSYFPKGVIRTIKEHDITVEITNNGKWYNIRVKSDTGSSATTTAQLDDRIIISKSSGFDRSNIISNGQVNITI